MTPSSIPHDTVLHSGVGAGAGVKNISSDVIIVQHLLNLLSHEQAIPENGHCTQSLVNRIRRFQFVQLRFHHPDGRVDPGGHTLVKLLEGAAARGYFRDGGGKTLDPKLTDALNRAQNKALQDRAKSSTAMTASAGVTELTDNDFQQAAARLGPSVKPALLHAFAEVESGGKSGFGQAGLPIIAYEGHVFRRYTHKMYDETHPLLSYRYVIKAGREWKINNADQKQAWRTLGEAIRLDRSSALMSCSWGMFQVMGFNYADCGYTDVDAFVADMKKSARGQLDAFVGYCLKKAGMVHAMGTLDFVGMASRYNGSDFGDYDKRIARAYARHGVK